MIIGVREGRPDLSRGGMVTGWAGQRGRAARFGRNAAAPTRPEAADRERRQRLIRYPGQLSGLAAGTRTIRCR
jgi:hypothetical protein